MSKSKKCSELGIKDIKIEASDPILKSRIVTFKLKKNKLKSDENIENNYIPEKIKNHTKNIWCEFIAEVEVFSFIDNTKKSKYKVNIKKSLGQEIKNLILEIISNIQNEDFLIENKGTILPSEIKVKSIKDIIKENISLIKNVSMASNNELNNNFRKAIDEDTEIILNPDDKNKILRFNFKFGSYVRKFEIVGFKNEIT